jgi:hypothetical protein
MIFHAKAQRSAKTQKIAFVSGTLAPQLRFVKRTRKPAYGERNFPVAGFSMMVRGEAFIAPFRLFVANILF